MPDIDLTAAEIEANFRRALDAFHRADWDAFRDTLAPDCRYEEIGTAETFSTREAYVERVKMWKAAMPDLTGTIDEITTGGQTVIAELTWRGTQTGTLETPMGPVAPTGKAVESRAAMVVEGDAAGLATRVRHYTNPYLLSLQLGLIDVPQATTTG